MSTRIDSREAVKNFKKVDLTSRWSQIPHGRGFQPPQVHFGVTRHPNETWTAQQLREATPFGVGPKFLIWDSDNKFGILLNRVAKGTGIQVLKIPFRTPPRAQRSGRLHAALSRTHFRQEPLDVWEYFVNPHERPHVVEPRQGDKRYVGYLLGTLLGKRVCLIHFSGVEHARHSY